MSYLKHLSRVAWNRTPKENLRRATRKVRGQATRSNLNIATVDQWWELTRAYPTMRHKSSSPLKDYGYLAVLNYIDRMHPRRVLEFGHGLGHSAMDLLYTRSDIELWACDDTGATPYYNDLQAWEAQYTALKAQYPKVHFVRALLGEPERTAGLIPENSFDLVTSVSVLEEIGAGAFERVIRHCYRLLVPGGTLLCSIDTQVGDLASLESQITCVKRCGFELQVDVETLPLIRWGDAVLEPQFVVMLSYLADAGENRKFPGNFTTFMLEAQKPLGSPS